MKKEKIFCVYCGTKNKPTELTCKKCHKKLNPKETILIDYLKDHIKDDLKGNIEDKFFSILKNFIISHLYGTIFTATLIFTITTSLIIDNDTNIKTVTKRPNILVSNLNKCLFDNSINQEYICEDGYNLENNSCIKQEQISAKENLYCNANYYLNGTRCLSNNNYPKETKQECIAPTGDQYLNTFVDGNQCMVNVCLGWTDGVCSAGDAQPIDFTTIETCPTGTSLINGSCKQILTPTKKYFCEEGTLTNNSCLVEKTKEPTLSCPTGYTYNEECKVCVGE